MNSSNNINSFLGNVDDFALPPVGDYVELLPCTDLDYLSIETFQESVQPHQQQIESIIGLQEHVDYDAFEGSSNVPQSAWDQGFPSYATESHQEEYAIEQPAIDALIADGFPEDIDISYAIATNISMDYAKCDQQSRDSTEEQEQNTVQQPEKLSQQDIIISASSTTNSAQERNDRSARASVVDHSDYQCDVCSSYFRSGSGLKQHKESIHSHRPYKCTMCGKRFDSQDKLEKHVGRHTLTDKPYKCNLCGRAYIYAADLKRHRLVHEITKNPFKCKLCKYAFIRSDHLISHSKRHAKKLTKKMPYYLGKRNSETMHV